MSWLAMLAEAASAICALAYMVLQVLYFVSYKAGLASVVMNVLVMLLVYAGLTLLTVYPEKVNGLTPEACSGKVRTYTLRMVRAGKLVFVMGLLFASVCDLAGVELDNGYSLIIVVIIVGIAVYYEARVIKILRERMKK